MRLSWFRQAEPGFPALSEGTARWVPFWRNRTLGAILDLLKENTSEEALVTSLAERFDAPQETIRQDVRRTLAELRQIGALDG